MNRRSFVSGIAAASSLLPLRSAFGAVPYRTPEQERVYAQLGLVVDAGLTVGAVMLAAQHGKVIAYEAAGYADAATKRPMRMDAIFDVRSISKIFTDYGILTLIEQGRLQLDQPLVEILPEFEK